MKNLRTLGTAVVLASLLSFTAVRSTSACSPPNPGQIETPPCVVQPSAPGETMTPPGQIDTPPAARDEAYLTEIASSVLFSILSLF